MGTILLYAKIIAHVMTSFIYFSILLADPGREAARSLAEVANAIPQASFTYRRVLDYVDPKFRHELTAEMYVDFRAKSGPINAKFLGRSADWTSAFNGNVLFHQSRGNPTRSKFKPDASEFESTWVMVNSLVGLGRSLDSLLADPHQRFELKAPNELSFTIEKRELGPIKLINAGYDPRYTIEFDPQTKIPSKITQLLANGKDTITTIFTNWNLKPVEPPKDAWIPKAS